MEDLNISLKGHFRSDGDREVAEQIVSRIHKLDQLCKEMRQEILETREEIRELSCKIAKCSGGCPTPVEKPKVLEVTEAPEVTEVPEVTERVPETPRKQPRKKN